MQESMEHSANSARDPQPDTAYARYETLSAPPCDARIRILLSHRREELHLTAVLKHLHPPLLGIHLFNAIILSELIQHCLPLVLLLCSNLSLPLCLELYLSHVGYDHILLDACLYMPPSVCSLLAA